MTLMQQLSAVAAALISIANVASPAQAGPTTGSIADLRAAVDDSSILSKTASRHCWRRYGQRHCANATSGPRAYRYRNRDSSYHEHIADKLPYGSQLWWDQMVRENRAGNPGGGGRN